jgi:hypothetical protein
MHNKGGIWVRRAQKPAARPGESLDRAPSF